MPKSQFIQMHPIPVREVFLTQNQLGDSGLQMNKNITVNYLEILACFLSLRAFSSDIQNCHVKVMIQDNTTAI